jgi:hypothetical protein
MAGVAGDAAQHANQGAPGAHGADNDQATVIACTRAQPVPSMSELLVDPGARVTGAVTVMVPGLLRGASVPPLARLCWRRRW